MDMVNHPEHYQSGKIEAIDVIEEFTKDLKGIEASDTANIIKYACRWKRKNGVEDLRKLVWYANHLINHIETKGEM
nr:MAG TPA: nucelotide kinase [Caudoviricetes sp.]